MKLKSLMFWAKFKTTFTQIKLHKSIRKMFEVSLLQVFLFRMAAYGFHAGLVMRAVEVSDLSRKCVGVCVWCSLLKSFSVAR